MSRVMLQNLELLNFKSHNKMYYGATQLWFRHPFKRLAGCGPTTGTNLFVYLSQTNPYFKDIYKGSLNYEDVFAFQKKIWKYITPSMMGVNSVEMFNEGALNFFKKNHLSVDVLKQLINPKNKIDISVLRDFLLEQISSNRPVAFLNLCAKNIVELSDWHWVLVVGIEVVSDTVYIYIYDEGFYRKINLSLWLEHTTKDGGFITYKEKGE